MTHKDLLELKKKLDLQFERGDSLPENKIIEPLKLSLEIFHVKEYI